MNPQTNCQRLVFRVLVSLFISGLAFANSQDLTHARELVETWRQSTLPANFDSVLVNLEQTFHTSGTSASAEQYYDFRNKKVYSVAHDAAGNEDNYTVYENGGITTQMSYREDVNLSQGLKLADWFRTQLNDYHVILPKTYKIISYDGIVNYGDIARGEQVTLSYRDVRRGNQEVTTGFIFSETGDMIATYQPGFLTLFEFFGFGDYRRVKLRVYSVQDGRASLTYEAREDYQFNKMREETSFASDRP